MKRNAVDILDDWKNRPNHKPMVIRGARQVGKSYLVRTFGQECFDNVTEINFELDGWAEDLFVQKNPTEALAFLEAQYKQRIVDRESGRTVKTPHPRASDAPSRGIKFPISEYSFFGSCHA